MPLKARGDSETHISSKWKLETAAHGVAVDVSSSTLVHIESTTKRESPQTWI